MAQFTDDAYHTWTLRIDIAAIRRVRALHGIDLAKVFASRDAFEALYSDIVLLVDVIYTICKPQADELGITDEQFGAGLAGDALGRAIHAFEEAAIEFLPESRRRGVLRQMIEAGRAMQAQATLRIENALPDLIKTGMREELTRLDSQIEQLRSSSSATATGP